MLLNVSRLVLLYKFGGWYADIDTIIMKPLTDFDTKFGFKEENLVSTDQHTSHLKNVVDKNGKSLLLASKLFSKPYFSGIGEKNWDRNQSHFGANSDFKYLGLSDSLGQH